MNVVELVCDECGRTFSRSANEHNRNRKAGRDTTFCSRRCMNASPLPHAGRRKPPSIPWLKPRTWQEQALGEMIAGAAIEYRKCIEDPYGRPSTHAGEDYWNGYWAALIDYGRRIFEVRDYVRRDLDDQEG